MRKYAYLKEPLKSSENNSVFKIMLYETGEGFYLFEYCSPDAVQCSSDRLYDSVEELYGDWNDYGMIGLQDYRVRRVRGL